MRRFNGNIVTISRRALGERLATSDSRGPSVTRQVSRKRIANTVKRGLVKRIPCQSHGFMYFLFFLGFRIRFRQKYKHTHFFSNYNNQNNNIRRLGRGLINPRIEELKLKIISTTNGNVRLFLRLVAYAGSKTHI